MPYYRLAHWAACLAMCSGLVCASAHSKALAADTALNAEPMQVQRIMPAAPPRAEGPADAPMPVSPPGRALECLEHDANGNIICHERELPNE